MEALRRELAAELPGQNLKVSTENGLVFLRGNVKDLNASNRAVQIAATAGKVINLLYVDVPAQPRQILLKVRFASVDRSVEKQLGLNLFSLNQKGVGTHWHRAVLAAHREPAHCNQCCCGRHSPADCNSRSSARI